MATTVINVLRDYDTALTAKLVSIGGTGTPNAAGYACTNTAGLQSFVATEALVGAFYLRLEDGSGDVAYQDKIVLADTVGPYWAGDVIAEIKADAELGTASGGMVAEVLKIARAAAAVTAGAPQAKHLENSLGATLQSVNEVLDGDA